MTLNSQPRAHNPKSYTLHRESYTLSPQPYTLNSTPYTLNPTPQTQAKPDPADQELCGVGIVLAQVTLNTEP